MESYEDLVFEPVTTDDINPMTEIMKRAFDHDTQIHIGEDTGGPTGYDNGDYIRKWYLHSESDGFKIIKDNTLIGGVNVFINKNQINHLDNIFIDPNYQDKGVGCKIWAFLEMRYPNTKVWKTETPLYSRRNHNFYINKCGFKLIEIKKPKDINSGIYVLEKEMSKTIVDKSVYML